jgi:CheY-like chemotaxis protein
MVVDDDEDTCEALRLLLESEGFEVLTALNAPEALSKLREENVDLVLIDILMPGKSGRDLAAEIRRNPELRNLKLVFLTVVPMHKIEKKELRNLAISEYITKPFENENLIRCVRKITGGSLGTPGFER